MTELTPIFFISLLAIALTGLISGALCRSTAMLLKITASLFPISLLNSIALLIAVSQSGTNLFFSKAILLDNLSLYHIIITTVVFTISSLSAVEYFTKEIKEGHWHIHDARRYTMLWFGFYAMLLLVLSTNNMGILWVTLEGSTLLSAFLILRPGERASIEAMWKYLLICSIGIAFALIGTFLLAAGSQHAFPSTSQNFLWSELYKHAHMFNSPVILASFVFCVIGFGTKGGLAPMHTWLPDAHSQAPTPVSAVFSGVMLNCALYGIFRYLPIATRASNSTLPSTILVAFGIISLVTAVIFITSQKDLKRMLAFSSIEHIGIITLGIGIGGLGAVAALLHTLLHSISKSVAFLSAGNLVQQYETQSISDIRGAIKANPLWGTSFTISLFSLLGIAPLAIFLSEFFLLKSLLAKHHFALTIIFLVSVLLVFITISKVVFGVAFGEPAQHLQKQRTSILSLIIVTCAIGSQFVLGLWIPGGLWNFLEIISSSILR